MSRVPKISKNLSDCRLPITRDYSDSSLRQDQVIFFITKTMMQK